MAGSKLTYHIDDEGRSAEAAIQPPLFDAPAKPAGTSVYGTLLVSRSAGTAARDDAMATAENAAGYDWISRARRALNRAAHAHAFFTTEVLWADGLPQPREPRALGPVMTWGQRVGLIAATDRIERSDLVRQHRRPLQVWLSLVYAPSPASASSLSGFVPPSAREPHGSGPRVAGAADVTATADVLAGTKSERR